MRVEISALSQTFPGRPPRPALTDVSLTIESGQFVALIGPSGCGKSTLLRILAHLLPVQQGQVRLDGRDPQAETSHRRVAWMAQSPALLPWLTAAKNVALAERFVPTNGSTRLSARQALEMVGLADVAEAYPFALSGGMQQRLALARTLMLDADLWLMDEPFAALDELTRERLTLELLALWQPLRPTVVWVTHAIHEAIRLADRVIVLSPRPARVTADISIGLERPRHESDPRFQALLSQLRAALGVAQP